MPVLILRCRLGSTKHTLMANKGSPEGVCSSVWLSGFKRFANRRQRVIGWLLTWPAMVLLPLDQIGEIFP